MKFFNLFKKELKEMLNTNMIVSLVISFVLLTLLGQFMQSSMDNMEVNSTSITICDLDNTNLTSEIIDNLNELGYIVNTLDINNNLTDVEISQQTDSKNILVIPKGFTQSIENSEMATIKNIGKVKGTSIMTQIEGSNYSTAIIDINNIIKNILIKEKSNFSSNDMEFINNPTNLDEVTIVNTKSENISASMVSAVISSQGTFVPIIIFVIIIFASQMIITAIATEKIDKTLETLLSTPISRISILSAKMLSAGLVSLISAVVYMLGFSMSMGSMLGGTTEDISEITDSAISTNLAMLSLGLTLTPTDYILIGLNIFLSIMIALSLSMMLGVMVNDIKSTQIVTMPVMFMALIPYLISYFADTDSLSPAVQLILNLIPFSHTFNATNNLMFNNNTNVYFGIAYQIIFLIVCMFFAIRLFQSDKILTASLNFVKRKKDNI